MDQEMLKLASVDQANFMGQKIIVKNKSHRELERLLNKNCVLVVTLSFIMTMSGDRGSIQYSIIPIIPSIAIHYY